MALPLKNGSLLDPDWQQNFKPPTIMNSLHDSTRTILNSRSARRTSRVWKYFRLIDNSHYVCCLCQFAGAYTNTTNMRIHIKNHHPEIYQDILDHTRPSNRSQFWNSVDLQYFQSSRSETEIDNEHFSSTAISVPVVPLQSHRSNQQEVDFAPLNDSGCELILENSKFDTYAVFDNDFGNRGDLSNSYFKKSTPYSTTSEVFVACNDLKQTSSHEEISRDIVLPSKYCNRGTLHKRRISKYVKEGKVVL